MLIIMYYTGYLLNTYVATVASMIVIQFAAIYDMYMELEVMFNQINHVIHI